MSTPTDRQVAAVEKILANIKQLLLQLELHKDDKLNDNPPNKKEILARFHAIQAAIGRFRKFNSEFFEKFGLTEHEVVQGVGSVSKGTDAERVLEMSQRLKIELLLSYASFFRKLHEMSKTSPLFEQGDVKPGAKEAQKKAVKQKFKTMSQRSKWKKM